MEECIRFDHVTKRYGTHTVLQDFRLTVYSGEFLTMIGRSGCGKTTALRLINGLLTPDEAPFMSTGRTWRKATSSPCAGASATPSRAWACFPT